jgi:nucleoside-diphosphate-sugar epimerase
VLEANTATFRTLSLRPHLIFGPNDTNLIPKLLDRGRKGRLVKIGEREPLVDFTFIGDCVQAHIKAFTSLERNDLPSGKAYFISQGEPYPFWEWVNKMLEYNKVPPVTKRINKHLAYTVATLLEGVGVASGYRFEPPLTRFLVDELATDHYFSIERAKSLLQFSPSISINDALKETFL